jgi:DNA-binding PadR family transcriptional regulator
MYSAGMVSKDLVGASSKPLVLSILAQGESYGYEIIQKVRELSAEELRWTDGMLYPVLHRLEAEGLIVGEWKQAETGRERKYYRLSSHGRKSLKAERRQWLSVHHTLCQLWKTGFRIPPGSRRRGIFQARTGPSVCCTPCRSSSGP